MGEIKKLGYYVNGSFKESKTDKYTDAYNPSTGEVIAKVPCCTPDEVEEAIAAAKAAFPGWSATAGSAVSAHGRADHVRGQRERKKLGRVRG